MSLTDFERFRYRMHVLVAFGLGMLLSAYSTHLWLARIPRMREIFLDFDVTLPDFTALLLRVPWLPAAVAFLGLAAATAAAFRTSRQLLAAAYGLVVFALAAGLMGNYALIAPLDKLIGSMTR